MSKLLALSREQLGVQTENNVALARLLLYFAVTFHRSLQMIEAEEDLEDYPTLYHWRKAASGQTTFADSLTIFFESILKMENRTSGASINPVLLPNPMHFPSLYRASENQGTNNLTKDSPAFEAMPV